MVLAMGRDRLRWVTNPWGVAGAGTIAPNTAIRAITFVRIVTPSWESFVA
jgi:hypothetical protein